MTTICCSRTAMAADRLVDDDGMKTYMTKIHRVGGAIIGVAGDAQDIDKFIKWYQDQEEDLDMDDSCAVVLTKDGIFTYESSHKIRIDDSHYAIGSGRGYAMTALDMGYPLEIAIKQACRRDTYSGLGKGGRVDILNLNNE